ncbi:MAG TPA: hypothetical protein VMR29_04040 [Candidatus Binatia bacterium]|nr:hypothetical protein [Candidatus Binatia bacterium]
MRRLLACLAAVAAVVAAPARGGAYPLRVPLVPSPVEIDAAGKLEFLDVERADSAGPYQNPQAKLRLHLTTDFAHGVRWVTDLTGTAGGTPRDPAGAGVYDFSHVKQDISPSLEIGEAYLQIEHAALDLRLGLQKFAWGKLDAFQPNDLLNPQKFYDPLLEEEVDRKIGVPAVAPTLYFPWGQSSLLPTDARLTLVWAPIYVPYYFPDQDERWYPPLARVPAESRVMGFTVENRSRFRNAPVPSRTIDNGSYAARFSALWGGADFALYYFDGFDPAPALGARARGFARFDPASPQGLDVRSEVEVFPEFERIRAAGADLAYRVFGATLRVEGAYVSDRAYPRSIRDVVASEQVGAVDPVSLRTGREQEIPVTLTPVNVRRNAVEWGAGGDVFVGDTFVLLQANQTAILRNDVNLLISDYETRFLLKLRRNFLADRLQAELIGLYGMQGVYGMAHPRVTYSINDYIDVRIGYVAIEGHSTSIFGQYKHNDEGYVRARFLF